MKHPWFWRFLLSPKIGERKVAYWLLCLKAYSDACLPLRCWDSEHSLEEVVAHCRNEYERQFRWYQMLHGLHLQLSDTEKISCVIPLQPFTEVQITKVLGEIKEVIEQRSVWQKGGAWFRKWTVKWFSGKSDAPCRPEELDSILSELRVEDLPRLPQRFIELEIFQNSQHLATAKVSKGSFIQGSKRFPSTRPLHEIVIPNPLLVCLHPVSTGLFSLIMGSDGKESKLRSSNVKYDKPVVNVSWIKAIEFCNRLSEKCGFEAAYLISDEEITCSPFVNGWRLLTESEWEYCATSGGSGPKSYPKSVWSSGNSGKSLPNLAQNEGNGFGLHDMMGLVWEWCWDAHDEKYYEKSPKVNPFGPDECSFFVNGDWVDRVKRGGSFESPRRKITPHRRSHTIYHQKERYIGFRICRRE